MSLSDFPRPSGDTGIGFHYFPDAEHYDRSHLLRWLPELKEMGASWLALFSPLDRPVPDAFLGGLLAEAIEPIIRLTPQPIQPIASGRLRELLRYYAAGGVHYVYFYSRPNMASQWPMTDWCQPDLVERFTDLLVPCLELAADVGLYPLLSPLQPGGDYWDTVFLEATLQGLRQKGKGYLFSRLGVAITNFAYNRPLEWGEGGNRRWQESLPYATPPGHQDQRGFYLFDWYDEVVKGQLGFSLPLLTVANGLRVGEVGDKDFPLVDEDTQEQRLLEMARLMREGRLPPYLFNHAFWLLASDGEEAESAWYKEDGTQIAAVVGLKGLAKGPRATLLAKAIPPPTPKSLYHYLLLPSEQGAQWATAAASYVECFQISGGFRVEEAMNAEIVTILGSRLGVDIKAERALRAAGCKVERLEVGDPKEARKRLKEMVRAGQRFLTL
ncbi:MAG: hypothetical protein HYU86_11685 [Chloroflexi bacterium]|nr:hypothetical protein [Chloroflexota bacterium]